MCSPLSHGSKVFPQKLCIIWGFRVEQLTPSQLVYQKRLATQKTIVCALGLCHCRLMKSKHESTQTRRNSTSQKHRDTDFKLKVWYGPIQYFRFLGWRDDYTVIYLLDETDKPLVLSIVPLGFQGPVRFEGQPLSITETRLLPPPCRRSSTEANLLRDMRKMVHGHVGNFSQIVQAYKDEAARLEIFNPIIPEQWELIYQDCLFPAPSQSPRQWFVVQDELRASWAKKNGLTLQGMVDERTEFLGRHVGDLAILAQARYRMECQGVVRVWLSDFTLKAADAVNDLGQIDKLLAARPELVLVTPESAEKLLGLKSDPKHRVLMQYCAVAKLDFKNLTRADMSALTAVRNDRKKAQSRAATRVNLKRSKIN